ATVRAGPYLAALDRPRLGAFLRVDGIANAAVFWRADATEPVLFRHLRSINIVDIPGDPQPPAAKTRTVLFRHYDPSVMAIVLRVLTPAQRARVFGPAEAIALYAVSVGGARSAKRQPDWPKPENGRLHLASAQMEPVAAGMDLRSRHAIAAFLRDAAHDATAPMDDAALLNFVEDSNAKGRELGIATERGLARWAYLILITRGEIADSKPARHMIADGRDAPDIVVGNLLLAAANAAGGMRQ
ncbi:MAG TPA: DUF4123 domain-containing protein, partial [Gemmataceae bacterium]|nr:DUF4123 domain-containing protein [Gemmataceae bacterium]